MKKFLPVVLAVASIASAFGSEMPTITNPQHRETGLPIAYASDADGVCIYLGYKKVLQGSSNKATDQTYVGTIGKFGKPRYRTRAIREEAMMIDSEGRPVRQKRAKIYESITCID